MMTEIGIVGLIEMCIKHFLPIKAKLVIII